MNRPRPLRLRGAWVFRTTFAVVFASRSFAIRWVYRRALTMAVCGRRCSLGLCAVAGRVVGGSRTAPTVCMVGLSGRGWVCVGCGVVICASGSIGRWVTNGLGHHIVGAVREPPTTRTGMRREGVPDNVRGGLLIIVACDSVCVSARDDDGGRWMALFIGLVRRGGTGRGRFTNRPYGLYGRAE